MQNTVIYKVHTWKPHNLHTHACTHSTHKVSLCFKEDCLCWASFTAIVGIMCLGATGQVHLGSVKGSITPSLKLLWSPRLLWRPPIINEIFLQCHETTERRKTKQTEGSKKRGGRKHARQKRMRPSSSGWRWQNLAQGTRLRFGFSSSKRTTLLASQNCFQTSLAQALPLPLPLPLSVGRVSWGAGWPYTCHMAKDDSKPPSSHPQC